MDLTESGHEAFTCKTCRSSENVRFASKVRENGSVCDPGVTRNHVYGRVGEPVPRKLVQGGFEDPLMRYDLPIVFSHRGSVPFGAPGPLERREMRREMPLRAPLACPVLHTESCSRAGKSMWNGMGVRNEKACRAVSWFPVPPVGRPPCREWLAKRAAAGYSRTCFAGWLPQDDLRNSRVGPDAGGKLTPNRAGPLK